jgi:hypothetical protein
MLAVKFDTDFLPTLYDQEFTLIRHHGSRNARRAVKAIDELLNPGNIDQVFYAVVHLCTSVIC